MDNINADLPKMLALLLIKVLAEAPSGNIQAKDPAKNQPDVEIPSRFKLPSGMEDIDVDENLPKVPVTADLAPADPVPAKFTGNAQPKAKLDPPSEAGREGSSGASQGGGGGGGGPTGGRFVHPGFSFDRIEGPDSNGHFTVVFRNNNIPRGFFDN